jgi:hypothetical protein
MAFRATRAMDMNMPFEELAPTQELADKALKAMFPGLDDKNAAMQHNAGAKHNAFQNTNLDNDDISRMFGDISSQKASDTSDTMEKLTDFIQKNINHAALKSINSFNASNLLQSLINAPGVFTPLAHYVIPLQIFDTRAFGELWIDNDSEPTPEKARGGGRKYHLFLTFDIETVGRFEVDMYAIGENVHIAMLYPEGYGHRADDLKTKIAKIVTQSGYNSAEIQSGVLKEPHKLTQVFPKITKSRKGLNVVV